MRQPSPSIEPFTPSSTVTLHPLLQAALDNLDVQIDQELSRYRRQRRYPTATRPGTGAIPSYRPAQTSPQPSVPTPVQPSQPSRVGLAATPRQELKRDLKATLTQTSSGSVQGGDAIGLLNRAIQPPVSRASIYAPDSPIPNHTPNSHYPQERSESYFRATPELERPSSGYSVLEQTLVEPRVAQSQFQMEEEIDDADYQALYQAEHCLTTSAATQAVWMEDAARPPVGTQTMPQAAVETQPLATMVPTIQPSEQINEQIGEQASEQISSYAQQYDLSAYTPSETLQRLMQQAEPHGAGDPREYLASSEELLRSIAEDEAALRLDREPNTMLDTLLTPLGVGSMLLLLLSSTTLGYVIMNPSSIGWNANAGGSLETAPAAPISAAPAQPGEISAHSPNLAAEEFINLGLETLSTLPKSSVTRGTSPTTTPSKTASPKPATSSRTSTTTSAATAEPESGRSAPEAAVVEVPVSSYPAVSESLPSLPEPQPSLATVVVPAAPPIMSVPEPAYLPPEPEPLPQGPVALEPIVTTPPPIAPAEVATAPTAPAVVPSSDASSSTDPTNGYYYVVTDYSGDASLQEARGAIPDAYVRNLPSEGAKVQLGAFQDEARAEELLQQLQDQGIQAEVYQP